MPRNERIDDPRRNPDPITKAPGSHPMGAGIGAAAGGAAGVGGAMAAGAALGTAVGPVGTAIGAAVGAVVGGLAGKGIAEGVNPTAEDKYWRENYASRPYVSAGTPYDQYAPAYRYGWEAHGRHAGKSFDEVEQDLGRDWDRAKGESSLRWDQAKQATREGWDRVSPREDDEV